MKKLFLNPDYTPFYRIYKLLPSIFTALTLIGAIVFGIIDACMEVTAIGDLEGAAVVIWLLIGAVAAGITLWISSICIAPTIVRTDATIEILAAIKSEKSGSYAQEDVDSIDALPEL